MQSALPFQQIQKYEKGANRIGSSRLFRIAQLLSVSVQFFFDDMPPDVADETTCFAESDRVLMLEDFVVTLECLQLNRTFSKIESSHVRKRLIDLAKTIADQHNKYPLYAVTVRSRIASSPWPPAR